MDAREIAMEHVIPSVGIALVLYMCTRPFEAVRQAQTRGSLGDLNPLPFVATFVQGVSWMIYGAMLSLLYIVVPGSIGVGCSYYCLARVMHLEKTPAIEERIRWYTHFCVVILVAVAALSCVVPAWLLLDIIGWLASLLSVMMYGSPLSEMLHVVRSGSSSRIHGSLAFGQTVCSGTYIVYGIVITNPPLIGTNVIGFLLALSQLLLLCVYPHSPSAATGCKAASSQAATTPRAALCQQREKPEKAVLCPAVPFGEAVAPAELNDGKDEGNENHSLISHGGIKPPMPLALSGGCSERGRCGGANKSPQPAGAAEAQPAVSTAAAAVAHSREVCVQIHGGGR